MKMNRHGVVSARLGAFGVYIQTPPYDLEQLCELVGKEKLSRSFLKSLKLGTDSSLSEILLFSQVSVSASTSSLCV